MEQTVSQPKTVLCTLIDKNDRAKYVCFTQKQAGRLSIGLSNGEDVWKSDVSEESLAQFKKSFFLKSTEDYALKLKCACRNGSAFISFQEDGAVLHLDSEPADLNIPLSKLTDLEGRTELKDLLFKMADTLTQLDAAGSTPSSSPVKSLQKKNTGFEPRKQQSSGPTVAVRKRLPGDSIINPGTKRKRAATGVDFDDGDDV